MVFHVVGFSCFSLKIGEMEIFHKAHRWRASEQEWVGEVKKSPLNFPHACSELS